MAVEWESAGAGAQVRAIVESYRLLVAQPREFFLVLRRATRHRLQRTKRWREPKRL